jgi:hypothetical protein
MAVADLGTDEADTGLRERLLQPEIGHQRTDDGALQPAARLPVARKHVQQVVAIADRTTAVDEHHPVAVAIERDAQIGAGFPHPRRQRLRVG